MDNAVCGYNEMIRGFADLLRNKFAKISSKTKFKCGRTKESICESMFITMVFRVEHSDEACRLS